MSAAELSKIGDLASGSRRSAESSGVRSNRCVGTTRLSSEEGEMRRAR